jgi:signal recognition particle subunit SRP54
MVLAELGGKLRDSLRKLHTSSGVGKSELNGLLGDIARALIEADVNVKLVMTLRDNIKKKVEHLLEEEEEKDANKTATSRTQNLSKIVQRTVVDELVGLLSPSDSKKVYEMRRGRPNVVLFVGLQGAGT